MVRAGSLAFAIAVCTTLFVGTGAAQTQQSSKRKVVARINPSYPELARRMRVSGVVKLEITIRADGEVRSIKVVGGSPVLIGAATDAVRKWKFEVASRETTETVQLEFDLPESKQ